MLKDDRKIGNPASGRVASRKADFMILNDFSVYGLICTGSKSAPIPLVSRVLGMY